MHKLINAIDKCLEEISQEVEMEFRFSIPALAKEVDLLEEDIYDIVARYAEKQKDKAIWTKVKLNKYQQSAVIKFKPFYYGRQYVSDRHTDTTKNTPNNEE